MTISWKLTVRTFAEDTQLNIFSGNGSQGLALCSHFQTTFILYKTIWFFQYNMIWKIHQMYYSLMHNALILNLTLVCTRLPRVLFKFSWGFEIMAVILLRYLAWCPSVQSKIIKTHQYSTIQFKEFLKFFLKIFHENLFLIYGIFEILSRLKKYVAWLIR